jgi:hypothetical protein
MNIHFSGVEKLRAYNVKCNAESTALRWPYGGTCGIQTDGPFSDIVIRDLLARYICDDCIGLNVDDAQAFYPPLGTGVSHGNGSDVLIDGVTLIGCRQGMRMLSSISSLDRVTVRNIKGDAYGCAIQINNWTNTDGPGHFGTIDIDGVDVRVSGAGYDNTTMSGGGQGPDMWCYINVQSPVTKLRISNFVQSDAFDARPAILFGGTPVGGSGPGASVASCVLEGIVVPATGTPIKVDGTVTFAPIYVGRDLRLASISGGGKLQARNTSTGVWADVDQWTNP